VLSGQDGRDNLDARDGVSGNDSLYGGPAPTAVKGRRRPRELLRYFDVARRVGADPIVAIAQWITRPDT
jgi:hypothetical protein